tara:strand:+ start:502 stop:930 length:429 start_codon:yes stop_codon:yes gene_type:complete
MNKDDYIKKVVSLFHEFCDTATITDYDAGWTKDRKYYINPEDWDMRSAGLNCDLGDCWREWYIGYTHSGFFGKCEWKSKSPPWTFNKWYPFWGKATKRKAILTLSIKKYWHEKKIKKLLNLLLICKKYSLSDDLRYIINKLI